MLELKNFSLCILLFMHLGQLKAYSSISYFFNNYLGSQKQLSNPRSQDVYSLEGTIITDGTKGFVNTSNLISVNISLKLGSSVVKTFYFSETDPEASYLVSDYITANNLFATDSHLGIVETYRNLTFGSESSSNHYYFQNNQANNKNLTIVDPDLNTRFLFYKNELNYSTPGVGVLFEYGSENYSNNLRFYNYYEPTIGPDPDLGSYFSFFNPADQNHMNNEMTADGYGDYAWSKEPFDTQTATPLSGTWVIASNVPEPSSLSLLIAGGVVLMAGRRKWLHTTL